MSKHEYSVGATTEDVEDVLHRLANPVDYEDFDDAHKQASSWLTAYAALQAVAHLLPSQAVQAAHVGTQICSCCGRDDALETPCTDCGEVQTIYTEESTAEPVAQVEASLMQRIQQRLAWLEGGQNIDVAEFCADVRTLAAQPRVPDELERDAKRWRFCEKYGFPVREQTHGWMLGSFLRHETPSAAVDYVIAAAPQPKESQP